MSAEQEAPEVPVVLWHPRIPVEVADRARAWGDRNGVTTQTAITTQLLTLGLRLAELAETDEGLRALALTTHRGRRR